MDVCVTLNCATTWYGQGRPGNEEFPKEALPPWAERLGNEESLKEALSLRRPRNEEFPKEALVWGTRRPGNEEFPKEM